MGAAVDSLDPYNIIGYALSKDNSKLGWLFSGHLNKRG
jgi:hypothetical protein